MAPNLRVKAAFMAMKGIGISEDKVKPVLKKLLKLYEKNWEMIEEENYRVLADAIFDEEDDQVEVQKRKSTADEDDLEEEAQMHEVERPLKRLRLRNQESQGLASPSNQNSQLGRTSFQPMVEQQEIQSSSVRQINMNKGKQPISPMALAVVERNNLSQLSTTKVSETCSVMSFDTSIRIRDKGKGPLSPQFIDGSSISERPCDEPKDERYDDEEPLNETPIAAILPDPINKGDLALRKEMIGGRGGRAVCTSSSEYRNDRERANIAEESPTNLEIASSPLGEDTLNVGSRKTNSFVPNNASNGSPDVQGSIGAAAPRIPRFPGSLDGSNNHLKMNKNKTTIDCAGSQRKLSEEHEDADSRSLVVFSKSQSTPTDLRSVHDVNDIAKGEERVKIPWVNKIDEQCPPSFHYIPQSLAFSSASINFSLSEIGNENCCSNCYGDCLPSPVPCACACANGGEFTYTVKGLVKEAFLLKCISVNRDPKKSHHLYCRECPLEKSKDNNILEPCKGHLKRKFIKECWRKCGCGKHCGNRVVQRGISYNMQVFMTPEGKGWGLQTLDELPKGAFVCEYIGEILTIKEMHERNLKKGDAAKRTYRVLLDSDWSSMCVKDDEALCLDSTTFGNIARFINHRCYDANLIEIPIEVETPKHHYYRLALFTTRKIQALEELTWDYGVEFDDHDHSLNAFQCLCGSRFCRNVKRSNRVKKVR
ncbi:hypothetical protein EUGRSUZ_K01433 [Eucalyptus grandis]|uniref:Uncharacterized protein n=2 Tax=Eucalyptus grandis TaxID=71139 RepID=A0ACC3ITA9_EUCGR|nr:hypothetical protein EUGRSUZ_K01433 [Eucalyptus grandis]